MIPRRQKIFSWRSASTTGFDRWSPCVTARSLPSWSAAGSSFGARRPAA